MESLKKESLELAPAVKTRVRDVRGSDTNRETVWERVQRLGRNQDPFERPTSVEQTQSASNVDLSFFGADVQCLLGARHHVVGSSYSRGGHYASAYRRSKSVKWSAEDTTRFYEAVRNFGSDLLMVRSMLPEFTDKQLYGKFKIEEKRNPERLHKALNSRTRIPVDKFEKRYGKIDSSRHYDPTKDPVLLHKKNQKTNQLALRTQVEGDQQSPSVVPQEELHIADVDEAESDVQACNIMQLFM